VVFVYHLTHNTSNPVESERIQGIFSAAHFKAFEAFYFTKEFRAWGIWDCGRLDYQFLLRRYDRYST
jgi:hypothetical protein